MGDCKLPLVSVFPVFQKMCAQIDYLSRICILLLNGQIESMGE